MTSNFFSNQCSCLSGTPMLSTNLQLECHHGHCYFPTFTLVFSCRWPDLEILVSKCCMKRIISCTWVSSWLQTTKKKHGCSLQRHIDASWGGTQNILDQQPYLITNEPLVLLHKCITMNSISRSSCNAFLARRSHIQLVCQPGYQHCDETTSRSPLILP